jgi:putative peptidoglycan lipid II flippase
MNSGGYPGPDAVSTESLGGVARSARTVGAATLASRVLGLLRDVVLASLFAPGLTDAFFIAFMIPNLFRRLVAEGSLTVSLVPIFTGELRRSREAAARLFDATWTSGAVAGVVIVVLGIAFADPLVRVFAPGFELEPGKHELTVQLLQLCFPYILLLILVATAMGALNAMGHFLTPAIAPVLLNLCLIAGASVGPLLVDPPILALGGAVVIAGLLQVALQVPPLTRRGLRPRLRLAPNDPVLRRLGALMAPAVLGASVFQLNVLVSRFLASFYGDGAVSYLYYAGRLIEFPLGVFVFAIGTASLPSFARLIAASDRDGLREAFTGSLGLALALVVPSTVGLVVLAEPIFSSLFGWRPSVFGSEAVRFCALALRFYALGLIAIAVSRIAVGLCIAHEDTRTPARAAVVGLLTNVVASVALIGPLPAGSLPESLLAVQHALVLADLGFVGLAAATSVASLANAVYLLAVVRRRYGRLLAPGLATRSLLLALACGAMGIALVGLGYVWPVPPAASALAVATLLAHVALGAAVYLAVLWGVRSPELASLRALLARGGRAFREPAPRPKRR